MLEPLERFVWALEVVFIGIIPSGFQRTTLGRADLLLAGKVVIIFEGLFALALATLLVMAIRRQFRR